MKEIIQVNQGIKNQYIIQKQTKYNNVQKSWSKPWSFYNNFMMGKLFKKKV